MSEVQLIVACHCHAQMLPTNEGSNSMRSSVSLAALASGASVPVCESTILGDEPWYDEALARLARAHVLAVDVAQRAVPDDGAIRQHQLHGTSRRHDLAARPCGSDIGAAAGADPLQRRSGGSARDGKADLAKAAPGSSDSAASRSPSPPNRSSASSSSTPTSFPSRKRARR